jgi:hypothetical protein
VNARLKPEETGGTDGANAQAYETINDNVGDGGVVTASHGEVGTGSTATVLHRSQPCSGPSDDAAGSGEKADESYSLAGWIEGVRINRAGTIDELITGLKQTKAEIGGFIRIVEELRRDGIVSFEVDEGAPPFCSVVEFHTRDPEVAERNGFEADED